MQQLAERDGDRLSDVTSQNKTQDKDPLAKAVSE